MTETDWEATCMILSASSASLSKLLEPEVDSRIIQTLLGKVCASTLTQKLLDLTKELPVIWALAC